MGTTVDGTGNRSMLPLAKASGVRFQVPDYDLVDARACSTLPLGAATRHAPPPNPQNCPSNY